MAVAGLPHRAERVGRAAGAIVVVDGSTEWWDAASLAVDAGAVAVLVAEPRAVPFASVARLADRADARGVPILVHRAALRADLVDLAIAQRAGAAPRVTVAECRATDDDLPAMVRDAVGWTRALAGVPLVVAAAGGGRDAATALLRAAGDGRVVGSVLVSVTSPGERCCGCRRSGGHLRTRDRRAARPHRAGHEHRRGAPGGPARLESGERASVRRAVDTVARASRASSSRSCWRMRERPRHPQRVAASDGL